MLPADLPEVAVLAAVQALLATRYPELDGHLLLQQVCLSVEAPGMNFKVTVRPRCPTPRPQPASGVAGPACPAPASAPDRGNPDRGDPDDADLTPTEQAIMKILREAGVALKQRAIARRAGKKYGPHFRTCCRRLADEGRIVQDDGGWRPATAADTSDPDTPDS